MMQLGSLGGILSENSLLDGLLPRRLTALSLGSAAGLRSPETVGASELLTTFSLKKWGLMACAE